MPASRQLDDDAAPVVGIGQPPDEPGLLEPVEPARHRAARELEIGCEVAGRAAVVGPREPQRRQHLPVGMRQAVLGERHLHAALDPAVDAADPVDDRLDLEVDVRVAERREPLQEAVDVVALAVTRTS